MKYFSRPVTSQEALSQAVCILNWAVMTVFTAKGDKLVKAEYIGTQLQ